MKRLLLAALSVGILLFSFTSCLGGKKEKIQDSESKKIIKVGYAQLGHESDWRIANSESFKNTFTQEKGYQLIFDDADGNQNKQIEAIRSFISQKVDYIVLAPVVETGWDSILEEVSKAGIPVILSDRQVKVADDSLYLCWVGGNFLREGRMSVKWLEKYLEKNGRGSSQINIVDIQGTLGASAQVGRTKGIEEGVRAHDNWHLIAQASGDFNQEGGRKVMEDMIREVGIDSIDVVFGENDNMAWGAIEAIREAGKEPGRDIIIVCYDAVKDTFNRMINGEINCAAECNPLHGPRVEEIIQTLEKGGTVDKIQYVSEGVFDQENAAQYLPERAY